MGVGKRSEVSLDAMEPSGGGGLAYFLVVRLGSHPVVSLSRQ